MKPIPLRSLCLAAASLTAAAAMSLDEAGVALGHEDFKTREQGEQVIRMAGMEDYDQVRRLSRSDDPEVASRARRSLPVILLGIDGRVPPELAAKLRRIDDFNGGELLPLVAAVETLKPQRPTILLGLHSHWQARPPAGGTVRHQLIEALEKAIKSTLDAPEALTEARRLRPELYQPATLGLLINEACRVQSGGLDPLLPLYDRWTAAHPQLPTLLNADGYRLELCRATNRMPTRAEALRAILDLATHTELSRVQEAAVRRQLAEYRDDAVKFPVNSLDQAAGWYFFSVLGSNQTDYGFLDSYREFRARFPEIDQASLLNQPLEVLLVLEKSGASAAFEYAVRQGTHGGMMMLAEWLRAHPALIREPLPLPVVKEGQPYPYRPVKFMRIFAPFADEAAMNSEPQIAAAYEILARDPRWIQVAKQARATNAGPSAKEKK